MKKYSEIKLLELVENLLGQPIPEPEREILESCHEYIYFIRNMDPIKNQTARLTTSHGQLIFALDEHDIIETLHRERTTGNQYRCAVRPLKKPTTQKLIVVTNLDTTKKTSSGVWFWDFSTVNKTK